MPDSYRDLFLSESQEFLNNISNCLVKLEENPADAQSINEIFRSVHTLKGMSATMGFEKLTGLSHSMEDLLDAIRGQKIKLSSEMVDSLFSCVDILEQLIQDISKNKDSHVDISGCIKSIKRYLEGESAGKETAFHTDFEKLELTDEDLAAIREAKTNGKNVLKINITIAGDCAMKDARAYLVLANLKKIGDVITALPNVNDLKKGKFGDSFIVVFATKETKESVRQELFSISEIKEVDAGILDLSEKAKSAVSPTTSYIKKIQSMRIPVERLDKIMNLMGELAIARIRFVELVQSYKIEPFEKISFELGRLISSLQDEIMQTRLLPVAYILDAFPRIVRDLSRRQDKEIDLEIIGGEIELDRVVLDEISDPLIHLVRNAIDHGIESSSERKTAGKKPAGKLIIKVARQKGQIFIEVIDDGRGIDFTAIRNVALNRGLLSEEEAKNLDERKVLELIASPGFSTATKVTDISGRGVGLDVVKSKIEALGGSLDFETQPGQGSRFILMLPLTLAIIKAMLVKVKEEIFAIPLMAIRETIKLKESELKSLQNMEVFRIRDEVIPTIRLSNELALPGPLEKKDKTDDRVSLVIVEHGKKSMGLVVSHVLGEQDIVVKPLGSLIKRTKGIAGATILGDGRVALILDTMSLR